MAEDLYGIVHIANSVLISVLSQARRQHRTCAGKTSHEGNGSRSFLCHLGILTSETFGTSIFPQIQRSLRHFRRYYQISILLESSSGVMCYVTTGLPLLVPLDAIASENAVGQLRCRNGMKTVPFFTIRLGGKMSPFILCLES